MSLYNMLHGQNPYSAVFLKILGIDQPDSKYDSGRFRDIFLSEDGKKLILYTRNGGANRDEYESEIEGMRSHPNFLTDYDDDFDSTYASFEFSIPDSFKPLIGEFKTGEKVKSISEKFHDTMDEMQKMNKEDIEKDPRFQPLIKLFGKIEEILNK